jgi:hypothetical protein
MEELLVKLMITVALLQIGSALFNDPKCRTAACQVSISRSRKDILAIPWKPFSVFSKEAVRFR